MKRWCSGRVLGFRPQKCWITLNLCHGASSVKLRILECFTLYLPNGRGINLRAIKNCICDLRSIDVIRGPS